MVVLNGSGKERIFHILPRHFSVYNQDNFFRNFQIKILSNKFTAVLIMKTTTLIWPSFAINSPKFLPNFI